MKAADLGKVAVLMGGDSAERGDFLVDAAPLPDAAVEATITSATGPTYTYFYAPFIDTAEHEHGPDSAEVKRVVKRGGVRGLDVANTLDMPPLYDPYWNPLWDVIDDSGMPLHFHTVGGRMPDGIRKTLWGSAWGEKVDAPMDFRVARAGFAVHISGFQIYMSTILMSMIYGGVLERHPRMRMIIGEGGIGWIPYILDHMNLEWEDQFGDLGLSMKPSEYWHRQCYATYQSDRIGIKMIDELGEDNVMWGSDFPHPDGVWPDSTEVIEKELGHLPAKTRRKIVCENAGRLYGLLPAGH